MRRRRSLSTKIYLLLRRIGFFANKKSNTVHIPILKIQKTVSSNGDIISHEDFMFAKNHLPKKEVVGKDRKICQYDFRTHSCRCGINLVDLKNKKKCQLENE